MSVIAYHESVEVKDQERVSVLARVEVISISHLESQFDISFRFPVAASGVHLLTSTDLTYTWHDHGSQEAF